MPLSALGMPANSIKLLIIDDDLIDRMTIQRSLAKANVQAVIDMAEKGKQGLAYLKENKYDCIFIDYILPDTDGVSLLRQIRAQGIDAPIVMVTSQGDERVAIDAIRSGASEYISKNLLTPEGVSYSLRTAIKLAGIEREKKAAEAALLRSENRLKEAQKLAKLGHFEVDLKTGKVNWSEEILNIFEVSAEAEPNYEDFVKFIHPEDRAFRQQILEHALQHKIPYQLDYRIITKKGNLKHIAGNGSPLIDETGELKGIVGTVQDISDRVSTREALRESEERYRMLIETMHEGVVHVDNDQQILFANQRFCEMMGYRKEEVLGNQIYLFVPDQKNRKIIEEKSAQRKQNISGHYEIQFTHKDGRKIYFLVGGNPLLNHEGEVVGSLGTFTDISERKKIEEALSSREKLLSTLFENAQSFICTHALDGRILSINKAGADIIGLPPTNLEGRNLFEFIEENQSDKFKTYLHRIKTEKQATGLIPFYVSEKGSRHYLLYRNVLYQESDKEDYVIVTAQDITERIHFEEELTKAKLIAENSVKVKEMFLANISHEIRTPMNGIIGLTGVLLKMVQDEEQKGFLKAIQSSADKLLVIINDILDFSKIEAGKINFEEIDFNPKKLLQESIRLFEARATEQNNKLKAIIDAEVPDLIKGDPGKLTQILNNLLSNAVKFTQNGQIKVFTEVISEDENTIWLEFVVHDTGIGIPEDKLSSIFESFTQASNDTSRKYGGTGLGLTISKQLVELQGGIIEVQSKPSEGSIFRVRLPFKPTEANAYLQEPTTTTKSNALLSAELGKLQLLLAEDNEINQILVKKIVSDWGFSLDIAENGFQALELFNQKDYDLILMDMQMPEMDGYEAIDYIRKNKEHRSEVPIIALTAHASHAEVQKCLQAGADAYVSKPFKPDDLLQEMAALLRRNPDFKPAFSAPDQIQPEQTQVNLKYLREMANGDVHFVQEILTMFIQQAPVNAEKLLELTKSENWPEIKALAHKMKSSVALIGNQELELILQDIQIYSLLPNQNQLIPSLVLRVKTICEKAVNDLKQELKTLE